MVPSYAPLEVIKLLLETFSHIFYILQDISRRKSKWNILYKYKKFKLFLIDCNLDMEYKEEQYIIEGVI